MIFGHQNNFYHVVAERLLIHQCYKSLHYLESRLGASLRGMQTATISSLLNEQIGSVDLGRNADDGVVFGLRVLVRGTVIGWERDEIIFEGRLVLYTHNRDERSEFRKYFTQEQMCNRWGFTYWPRLINFNSFIDKGAPDDLVQRCKGSCKHCERLKSEDWRSP